MNGKTVRIVVSVVTILFAFYFLFWKSLNPGTMEENVCLEEVCVCPESIIKEGSIQPGEILSKTVEISHQDNMKHEDYSVPFCVDGHKELKDLMTSLDIDRSPTHEEKIALSNFLWMQQEQYILEDQRTDYQLCKSNIKRYDPIIPLNVSIAGNLRLDIYLDLFIETVNCDLKYRFGAVGDGGYWVCDPHKLLRLSNSPEGCVVYSFGVQNDLSFDNAISLSTGCEVHAFDPKPTEEQLISWKEYSPNDKLRKVTFHRERVDPSGNQSLGNLAKKLGHSKVDIIKIDIESATLNVMTGMLKSGDVENLGVKQFLFEQHPVVYDGNWCRERLEVLYPLLKELHSQGFHMFKSEVFMVFPNLIQYHYVHQDFL